MSKISGKQHLDRALAGFEQDLRAEFTVAADRIRGELARIVTNDDTLNVQQRQQALIAVGDIIDRLFVGEDRRRAYADEDGAQPLSPVARLLSKWLVEVQTRVVLSHAAYMQRQLQRDPDVWRWLSSRTSARLFELDDVPNPVFSPDPLARYEAAHTWVDPKGYRLSDRIWRSGQRTRDKIDRVVSEGLRQGWSSMRIADAVEGYLLPGREAVRTSRPYDLDASFDAMRLARTEIGRAHAQASRLASAANPYVTGMDYALSASHPRVDICDNYATLGKGGGRIREPYPKGEERIPISDTHPNCLCYLVPYVSESPEAVMAQLREEFRRARGEQPPPTVAGIRATLIDMLGRRLFDAFVAVDLG